MLQRTDIALRSLSISMSSLRSSVTQWPRYLNCARGARNHTVIEPPPTSVCLTNKSITDTEGNTDFLHSTATPPYGRPRSTPAEVSTADLPVNANWSLMLSRNGISCGNSHVS
uniref:SFRICE_009086 n=1 Tax=Spodoptera frugiperda TaxID=7108 RepID=A0A2H1VQI5_SPOFR